MIARLLFLLLVAGGGYGYYLFVAPIPHPPGMLVPMAPVQQTVQVRPFAVGEYQLQPLASYDITARVLSTHAYPDKLVPYDLALGWQEMSDSTVIDQLDISQVLRFYQYGWKGAPPVAPDVIVRTSANTHIIPATDAVRNALPKIRRGELVNIKGYLVNASKAGGWLWSTSLTRTDSGNGGCELLYATSLTRLSKP